MEVLDSPFDSVVRTLYVSAALRSFCTWLSVHAATFAIWIRRFFSHPYLSALRLKPPPTRAHNCSSSLTISWCPAAKEHESARKSRFTAYYHHSEDDDEEDDAGEEHDRDELATSLVTAGLVNMDRTPALPVRRTTELGWYASQDMSILDGSVVRLWAEDGGKLKPSPTRQPSSLRTFG